MVKISSFWQHYFWNNDLITKINNVKVLFTAYFTGFIQKREKKDPSKYNLGAIFDL